MQTFVWGEEFYTGESLVDEQHHGLVDLFNRLSESLVDETSEEAVELAFAQLMDYAKTHFSAEEALMRSAGVDVRHVTLHRRLHDEFTDQVLALWGARQSLANPAEIFLSFLTAWLCLHVLGVDQSLARQLAVIRSGEAAEQAFYREEQRPKDKSAEAMITALRNTYRIVSQLSLELISANRFLENRVAARTVELQHANAALQIANQQLEVYSQTDGLLGIANRQCFDRRLVDEWNRAIRDQLPLGLLMIDVDFFKNYNDEYGHLGGDSCLQAVARVAASKMVRAVDLLARYGGEEFVVILPHTALAGAKKVAESIRAAVSALAIPHRASAVAEYVTVSIGVASLLPDRSAQASDAVLAADRALYLAKQQGRNRVCVG